MAVTKLLLAFALVTSSGELRTTLRGNRVVENLSGSQSCGAAARLLIDTYRVVVTRDRATVNMTPWTIVYRDADVIQLEHHASPDAITRMVMQLDADGRHAWLSLVGATEEREPCADQVELVAR